MFSQGDPTIMLFAIFPIGDAYGRFVVEHAIHTKLRGLYPPVSTEFCKKTEWYVVPYERRIEFGEAIRDMCNQFHPS